MAARLCRSQPLHGIAVVGLAACLGEVPQATDANEYPGERGQPQSFFRVDTGVERRRHCPEPHLDRTRSGSDVGKVMDCHEGIRYAGDASATCRRSSSGRVAASSSHTSTCRHVLQT